jgi:hypothetical protein
LDSRKNVLLFLRRKRTFTNIPYEYKFMEWSLFLFCILVKHWGYNVFVLFFSILPMIKFFWKLYVRKLRRITIEKSRSWSQSYFLSGCWTQDKPYSCNKTGSYWWWTSIIFSAYRPSPISYSWHSPVEQSIVFAEKKILWKWRWNVWSNSLQKVLLVVFPRDT